MCTSSPIVAFFNNSPFQYALKVKMVFLFFSILIWWNILILIFLFQLSILYNFMHVPCSCYLLILTPCVFNSCQILFLLRFILMKNILNPTCFEPKIYILWDQGKLSWSNKLDFNWHHLHSSCWFLQGIGEHTRNKGIQKPTCYVQSWLQSSLTIWRY